MEKQFVPIDYDYFDYKGKNFIKLIGRDEKGNKICVIDSYEPHIWVVLEDSLPDNKISSIIKKIEKIKVKKTSRKTSITKTEIKEKKFLGKEVKAIKLYIENYKDAHAVADELSFKGIDKRREYDLNLITKYIMEEGLEPLQFYEVELENLGLEDYGGIVDALEVENCYELKSAKKIEKDFEPKVLAYDIESDDVDAEKGEVLMISLYGKDFKKVLTWKKCSVKQDFVECLKDESEMIEKFTEYVNEQDPDFLVGYFSDGFDLPFLRHAAKKNGISLALGIDRKNPKFTRGRIPSGSINGIVHTDIFRFIDAVYSQYLQSETLSLDDVSSELLGANKHSFDFTKLSSMKKDDWKDFFKYNLRDSELTYNLFQKIWPDILEFTRIIKEPSFEITRDRMSSHVENYVLHNLKRFNEIAEKRPLHKEIGKRRSREKYEGAFVFEPTPGLYEDVTFFDFTSFWPSIIVSYNLSRSTFHEKKESGDLEVDSGRGKFYFSKQKGFFPEMLNEVIELRKKYKKEFSKDKNALTKARSNAYKLLANASYGYQGFFGARYYCPEASASATALSRNFIQETIDKIKSENHKIVYSDTDSIAFLMGKKSKNEVLQMLEKINKELPGIMELELEDFYKRALFVLKRGGKGGAKKKYALIDEKNNLKIRGFETVRRDWCQLARELQSEILQKILQEGNEESATKLLKKKVDELKKRKIDLKKLLIKTQLKKPINEYLSEGPHVVAAKKMRQNGLPISQGMLIEYYVAETAGNSKRVGDKVKLPNEEGKYEIDYYLNNQILPAVENIFEVFSVKVQEIFEGEKQETLF